MCWLLLLVVFVVDVNAAVVVAFVIVSVAFIVIQSYSVVVAPVFLLLLPISILRRHPRESAPHPCLSLTNISGKYFLANIFSNICILGRVRLTHVSVSQIFLENLLKNLCRKCVGKWRYLVGYLSNSIVFDTLVRMQIWKEHLKQMI